MASERVVAVVPAFEAAATVGAVVERTLPFVERVLVVDDGSTDDTAAVALDAGAEVERHVQNLGKGAALCTGFARLREEGLDGVLTIDADGQHLPEEAPKLLAARGAALVLGVRAHRFDQMSALRRAANRSSSWGISLLAGVALPDVQTGFRLYRRAVLEPPLLRPGRFDSESGVVVRAARRGLHIESVPVEMALVDGRGTSHYRPLVDSLRIARAAVSARLEGGRGLSAPPAPPRARR